MIVISIVTLTLSTENRIRFKPASIDSTIDERSPEFNPSTILSRLPIPRRVTENHKGPQIRVSLKTKKAHSKPEFKMTAI